MKLKIENKEMANNHNPNDYKSDVNMVSNDRKERERELFVGWQHSVARAVKF